MEEYFSRSWEMLIGRMDGPFAFRVVLQPLAASIIAFRAGLRDARAGRPAFGWCVLTNPVERHELLREAWRELAKVFLVAVVIDLIYEIVVFHRIYPGQSLIVATLFAFLPYPIIRGSVNRILSRWRRGHRRPQHAS